MTQSMPQDPGALHLRGVVLPEGVYYGRVEPSEAWPVLEAALDGRVRLPHYRGRSCHGFAAQAAERSVREQTGLLGVFDVKVVAIERDGDGGRRRELSGHGGGNPAAGLPMVARRPNHSGRDLKRPSADECSIR